MSKEIKENIAQGALLLDVRSRARHQEGRLVGSVNIPMEELPLADLPQNKEKPVYVYCSLGITSQKAKLFLEEQGYSQVVDLGGIQELVASGFAYDSSNLPD